MPFRWSPREHLSLGIYILKWVCLATPKLNMLHLPLGDSLRATRELRPGWGTYFALRRSTSVPASDVDKKT